MDRERPSGSAAAAGGLGSARATSRGSRAAGGGRRAGARFPGDTRDRVGERRVGGFRPGHTTAAPMAWWPTALGRSIRLAGASTRTEDAPAWWASRYSAAAAPPGTVRSRTQQLAGGHNKVARGHLFPDDAPEHAPVRRRPFAERRRARIRRTSHSDTATGELACQPLQPRSLWLPLAGRQSGGVARQLSRAAAAAAMARDAAATRARQTTTAVLMSRNHEV